MNKYMKMIIFVVALGVFTSIILLGMDELTSDRIKSNDEAFLKSAILDGYDIPYTYSNINQIFNDNISIYNYEDLTFYQDNNSNNISFQFEGNGVWGPIIGIITLDSTFTTIQRISILAQEETPGLGGVVAERQYLDNFVGKQMEIEIIKNSSNNTINQIDSIVGATRTSEAFEDILNTDYLNHKSVWESN